MADIPYWLIHQRGLYRRGKSRPGDAGDFQYGHEQRSSSGTGFGVRHLDRFAALVRFGGLWSERADAGQCLGV